ncbi:MAG: YdeI/OmpD-associated family protein [Myxococcaceae bacterium]
MSPKVDSFIKRQTHWRKEFEKLREIILGTGLDEDLKWGQPCYSHGGKNVVLMHGFNEYCAVLFPKGALLNDPKHLLIQQTKNVQAARQIRFTGLAQLDKLAPAVKAYVKQAIEIEKQGLKVPLKKTEDFEMPEELSRRLGEDQALKDAFRSLTPGRQRGYILYFGAAKQAATREARIEKYVPRILEGMGLND